MKRLAVFFIVIFFAIKANAAQIEDLLGRHIDVNHKVSRIVAIGPGALRLVCYMGLSDKVVGIENIERHSTAPYIIANPSLLNLPTIGQGGPNSSIDTEKILSVRPDVIFVTYLVDKRSAETLQDKTHIPVVILSYGKIATFDNNDFKKSLMLIGEICDKQDRAKQIISFLDDQFKQLRKLSQGKRKASVYIGALGMRGAHGIESTQGDFLPFKLLSIYNVASSAKISGAFMMSKEQLLALNPDYIFIDYGGLALVKQDYKANPSFYNSLKAFKNKNVFIELPYNYYATNIDNALIDTYWVAKVVYKKNVNMEQKANQIYEFLLGKPLYNEMLKYYPKFQKVNF